ncbi:hypothetical protein TRAPUB_6672 [Trametes pubescens]|uniref:Uncharacterized protein n=1 Tax=Trametes pubescens TaxID=154538 RepID=A0A1M2V5R0_TRAPU|nr:hypothetical protein TRAPUB_6672 [Trametes pubescens]
MSQTPYATWPAGVKPEPEQYSNNAQSSIASSRRSAAADQQAAFAYAGSFPQADAQRRMQSRSGMRPHSSSTSSLSGAMGDTQIGAQPRTSVTPPSGLASWTPSPTATSMSGPFMAVPEDPSMAYLGQVNSASPSGAFAFSQYAGMGMYASPETSPGLVSGFSDQYAYSQDRGQQNSTPPSGAAAMIISPSSTPAPMQSSRRTTPERLEEENRRLQQRIRQLEIVSESSRRRVRELETELSRGAYAGGLPTPIPTPQPHPTFNEEWQARTDARIRTFCSLNRAGNALCAWHDSRRERRAYPPRMAPKGHLNCGCTYDQALFEESLSRHGVGSYHPGESVRMDPALRNPLLQLLQARYGYRDGDFERDPLTGNWREGEGAEKWEQKAASGGAYSRRARTEADRRST